MTIEEKPAQVIREAQAAYMAEKRQGEFTIEDYFALPDERRVELIDGVIYDMAVPTPAHQLICGEIHGIFRDYIRRNKGTCFPVVSPVDVQLDCDDKTMVQPDVLILCDRDKFMYGRVYGAPDLIVEILSPSTRKKDTLIKTAKYMEAGVREYWIVDAYKKRIVVYIFGSDELPVVYSFADSVPVSIFGGKCEVNFAEIYEYVHFLYEEDQKI